MAPISSECRQVNSQQQKQSDACCESEKRYTSGKTHEGIITTMPFTCFCIFPPTFLQTLVPLCLLWGPPHQSDSSWIWSQLFQVHIDVEVGKLPAWPEIHTHARMDWRALYNLYMIWARLNAHTILLFHAQSETSARTCWTQLQHADLTACTLP